MDISEINQSNFSGQTLAPLERPKAEKKEKPSPDRLAEVVDVLREIKSGIRAIFILLLILGVLLPFIAEVISHH